MAVDKVVYAYIVKEESFADHEIIVQEGVRGDWAYVILEGQVQVRKNQGEVAVNMGTMSEGDIFGEMELLNRAVEARTATVVADGPVKVGLLDTEQLKTEYEKVSPRLKGVIASLLNKMIETNKMAVALLAAED